jgi:hypothetical protein
MKYDFNYWNDLFLNEKGKYISPPPPSFFEDPG